MLQIAICDDDSSYLEYIKSKIEEELKNKDIEDYYISEFNSSLIFYDTIQVENKYDVIFLDISMPEINGIKIAEKIREKDENVILIFMTAFFDYALEGYRLQVLRFIVKDMVDKLLPECIDAICSKLNRNYALITYPFVEGRIKIFVREIKYIESRNHKLFFHLKNNMVYSLYEKLDIIDAQFKSFYFLRVHKSFLINMEYIEEIKNYNLTLTTGEKISVSKDRFKDARKEYYAYLGGK